MIKAVEKFDAMNKNLYGGIVQSGAVSSVMKIHELIPTNSFLSAQDRITAFVRSKSRRRLGLILAKAQDCNSAVLIYKDLTELSQRDTEDIFSSEKLEKWIKSKIEYIKISSIKNSYPVPSEEVVKSIRNLLIKLDSSNIIQKFINPSIEGGIVLEFEKDNKYFIVDYGNNGEIGLVIRNEKGKRWAFDLNKKNFIKDIIAELET